MDGQRLKQASRRQPLSETQAKTRPAVLHTKIANVTHIPVPTRIPHHESARPEGNLSAIARGQAPSPTRHGRAAAIVEDERDSSKRDSQISTTSTISNRGKKKTHIGPWQLGKTLGKGATGRVRLARHALTGQTAAIKIVSKQSAVMVQSASMAKMDDDVNTGPGVRTMPFGIEREIVIMKLIEHPNVISLYDIWENRGELYLVLEYVEGGELFDYVSRNHRLKEAEAVRLLRQLIGGLSYCHRFNICHRDLKPENLLLDKDHNLKIADFGMAALQPRGQFLTTSCGSPHYAAPEIIQGKQYSGDATDIWSVGIILYAMLNGFLPFDGGGLTETLSLVKKGAYFLPPDLSIEATDLIQRILQKQPENRITMAGIWTHPLLKKYERLHASLAHPAGLVGPPPPLPSSISTSRALRSDDVDREVLRNLRVLWHGQKEEQVLQSLISSEPNHEKLFYHALVKFRDEQLENYPGNALDYSASDYHHVKRPPPKLVHNAVRMGAHHRRQSQFSIVSGESVARNAYYKNSTTAVSKTTEGSYDPYRASRAPITSGDRRSTTIVVHQGDREPTAHSYSSSSRAKRRLPSDVPSLPTFNSQELAKIMRQKRAACSAVSSRSSLASSPRKTAFKKSASYRRQIVFQHRKRSSSHTASTSRYSTQNSTAINAEASSRPVTQHSNQTFPDSQSTPSMPTPHQVVRPRRPASDLDIGQTRKSHAQYKEETRIVSAELSKICEEAFNRSSVSYVSSFDQQMPIDSPATTISTGDVPNLKNHRKASLPLTPALQELIDRKRKIIENWGGADTKTLAEVIETLDRRIFEEQHQALELQHRSASEPIHGQQGQLCAITSNARQISKLDRARGGRAASDPLHAQDNTIRMVSPDLSSPMRHRGPKQDKLMPINSLQGSSFDSPAGSKSTVRNTLEPIPEDPLKSPKKVDMKRWPWLKKNNNNCDDIGPTPPRKDTPKDRKAQLTVSTLSVSSAEAIDNLKLSDETIAKKQKWFQRMFRREDRTNNTIIIRNDPVVSQDSLASAGSLLTVDFETPIPQYQGARAYRHISSTADETPISPTLPAEPGQNWFAKLFHLKPAMNILVLNTSKVRARKEVVKVLREWRKFGIRDITVEKTAGGDVIRARVDVVNYLYIRPVSFYASVYTVLERGKSGRLSIVKFIQEKGAASSFNRVIDTLESVLRENNLVLDDSNKRKAILKSMKKAGL